MTTVRAIYPVYCFDQGVCHTCLSICEGMRDSTLDVRLTVAAAEASGRRDFVHVVLPDWLKYVGGRPGVRRLRHWFAEHQFLRQLEPSDVAYVWPVVSPWVYEEIKARGNTLVMERVNCHRATIKRILDQAYERVGWPAAHGITDHEAEAESHKLALADHVFCPSPYVRQSMLDAGVAPEKILDTTYGWDPRRFPLRNGQDPHRLLPRIDGITVLFVGYVCVRKGAHLLLDWWAKAGIKGRLVLAGRLSEEIATHCADLLNRPDVVHIDYCSDIGTIYRSADVFAFPTLEEGSPQVSYEAMAHALPMIVSPMGAGACARPGQEALICEPYDTDAWIDGLRRLATDTDLREALGYSARVRAEEFTWDQVGRRRRVQLKAALAADEQYIPHSATSQTVLAAESDPSTTSMSPHSLSVRGDESHAVA